MREFNDAIHVAVVGPHSDENLGHFLTVRSDVLHRCSSNGSGNAAQAFDASQLAFHTQPDKRIPFLSRARTNDGLIRGGRPLDTTDADLDNNARKT